MATRLAIREKQLANWAAIVRECKTSGMKTKDWLAENNISKDQYYYWFRQLRNAACAQNTESQIMPIADQEKPQIVRVDCSDYQNDCALENGNSTIQIKRGSISIEINGSADPAAVRSIMEGLVNAE